MLSVVTAVSLNAGDRFGPIKTDMSDAGCVRLDFLSIIESDIFDVVDTASGRADIASDGRYLVTLGEDVYLYDGIYLYSYSGVAGQVVIEPGDDNSSGSQVSFITRLDHFYRTSTVRGGEEYRLILKDGPVGELPDSMRVFLHPKEDRIAGLEYFDINEELNRIEITGQQLDSICGEDLFIPAFPDSVERVRLY